MFHGLWQAIVASAVRFLNLMPVAMLSASSNAFLHCLRKSSHFLVHSWKVWVSHWGLEHKYCNTNRSDCKSAVGSASVRWLSWFIVHKLRHQDYCKYYKYLTGFINQPITYITKWELFCRRTMAYLATAENWKSASSSIIPDFCSKRDRQKRMPRIFPNYSSNWHQISLVGGFNHLEKWWSSWMGRMTSHIWNGT